MKYKDLKDAANEVFVWLFYKTVQNSDDPLTASERLKLDAYLQERRRGIVHTQAYAIKMQGLIDVDS